jgi:serine/threonine-protein kinase
MGISGSATQTGGRLGRYELLARLATGGMGEIFLARLEGAEGFEKLYVVKRILAHLADDARFRQMLVAEARIASKMSHPNICQVFELGEDQNQLYIVMEYLEGVSLLPLMRRFSKSQQQLDLGFIAGVFQQTTDAMNYAHELKDRSGEYLGLIHRDVTPSNIFITESGVSKVLDFGIAKAKGASTQTQEGTVKGKYAYMAPEQLKGAAIDRRVDIFAMGVVLYEMLALRRLFQRKTDYLTFRAVMEQPIPDIRRYRPDVPDSVADAMMRALDRDPNNRFETARQFGNAVLDALAQFKRPWSQGELGDFVRHYFAEEIHKRSTQVAQVISRTGGGSARATMPLLAHPDDQTQIDDSDDDEFPSVETDVDAPPWMPRPAGTPPFNPNGPQNPADFAGSTSGGTPPPFGAETTGSAPALQPLRGAPVMMPNTNTAPIMVVPQRSVVWPVVAVLMVLVTGGALFLVWKQTQNKQPALVIERESNPPPIQMEPAHEVIDAASAAPVDEPANLGSGSATAKGSGATKVVRTKPPVTRPKTYDAAIQGRVGDLNSCVVDHRDAIPQGEMFALIKVGASGSARSVRITPDSANSSTLGACLRNVLMTTTYPTAGSDVDIKIPLNARAKR